MTTRSKSRAANRISRDADRAFHNAQNLLDNEKYVEARFALETCGHFMAPCELGRLYELGCGVDKDLSKAADYYQKGVLLGDELAAYRLGVMYLEGSGVRKNREKAKKLLEAAAEKSVAPAMRRLAEITRSVEDRMDLYAEAAEEGDEESMRIMEKWYRERGEIEKAEFYRVRES